jgi:hypothetical protein
MEKREVFYMSSNQRNLEDRVEQAKAAARKYAREGWGSRATVFHALYDVFQTDTNITPEECYKICCILDPFHAIASAIYENGKANGLTICGALSGGLAGFSMVHGWRELPFKFWSEGMKPDGWLGEIIDNPLCLSRGESACLL